MSALRVHDVTCPQVAIDSDCQSVLDGFVRGAAWAARPAIKHRDLWARCWALIAEYGGPGPRGMSFQKVEAHATTLSNKR